MKNGKYIKIPVTFEMCGVVEVYSEDGSIATAIKNFNKEKDIIDLPEPEERNYVDGSFEMTTPFEGAEEKDLIEFVKTFN